MNPGRDWRFNGVADRTLWRPTTCIPRAVRSARSACRLMLRFPRGCTRPSTTASTSRPCAARRSSSTEQSHAGRRPVGRRDRKQPVDAGRLGCRSVRHRPGQRRRRDNLNFLEPDQCDDMHGVKRPGHASTGTGAAGGERLRRRRQHLPRRHLRRWSRQEDPGLARLDQPRQAHRHRHHVRRRERPRPASIVLRLEPERRAAIAGQSLGLLQTADGTSSGRRSIANYNQGNKGHGTASSAC